MRVLYLVDSLEAGGAQQGLVRLLEHLDRDRVRPQVAYLWEPSPLTEQIERMGIHVERVRARQGDWALLSIMRVRRVLRETDADVLHTKGVWSSISGRIAGRLAKVRVVSDLAGADAEGWVDQVLPPREARRVKDVNRLDSLTARFFVDRFIAPSAGAGSGSRPERSKVTVVPRGQDLEALRSRAGEDPSPPLGEVPGPLVVAVGDLTPAKDQRSLVDAMAIVRQEFPEATLAVAGEGSLRRMLEERAKPLGEGAVRFLGRRDDVPALLAKADVFASSSVWEGTGSALVEAMAIGAPIVATRIPIVLDTVRDGETAILAKAGDPRSLADAIIRVLRDPVSAEALGERARFASESYDVRATTEQLETVYQQVVNAPRPGFLRRLLG